MTTFFPICIFKILLTHPPIVKHVFVLHFFLPFFFLNSAAVKTLKCLSDVFSREIFINGVARSENTNVFKALDINGQISLQRHPSSLHFLWQHTRMPISMHCCQNHVLYV